MIQPDGIGIPSNELVYRQSINGRWSFDSLLFTVDKNPHVRLAQPFFLGLLFVSEFVLLLRHGMNISSDLEWLRLEKNLIETSSTTTVLTTKFDAIFAKKSDDLEIHVANTVCLY